MSRENLKTLELKYCKCGAPARPNRKSCSNECGARTKSTALAERYYRTAVENKPDGALRVTRMQSKEHRQGRPQTKGQYVYIFLCRECEEQEVWHPVYYFSNIEKYGKFINYHCRTCSNKHNWDKKRRPYESTYSLVRASAVERNLEFALTFDEFLQFIPVKVCEYCAGGVEWNPRRKGHAYNLDRKSNEVGYIKNNLVVCCRECNRIKSDVYSYDQMKALGSILQEMRVKHESTSHLQCK